MSNSFTNKKRKILEQLNAPSEEYTDASPKGSVDEPIREFVDEINAIDDLVTTSSCSGRFAFYLEGAKRGSNNLDNDSSEQQAASTSGKGGGQWLYVTHDPLPNTPSVDAMILSDNNFTITYTEQAIPPGARLIHFKFEPMILHILASSVDAAKRVLSAAQVAGFRESGISSISGPPGKDADMVMVAVRSTGLSTDSPIGYLDQDYEEKTLALSVSEAYVQSLVSMANEKFSTNTERTQHFRKTLLENFAPSAGNSDWEPADVRKARKREEGLRKQAEARSKPSESTPSIRVDLNLNGSALD
ncbi:hypothetical protein MBLNU457_g0481t1 [Dothideomycetes sp. NU457]